MRGCSQPYIHPGNRLARTATCTPAQHLGAYARVRLSAERLQFSQIRWHASVERDEQAVVGPANGVLRAVALA